MIKTKLYLKLKHKKIKYKIKQIQNVNKNTNSIYTLNIYTVYIYTQKLLFNLGLFISRVFMTMRTSLKPFCLFPGLNTRCSVCVRCVDLTVYVSVSASKQLHHTVCLFFLLILHKLQSHESINPILSGSHRPNTLLFINKPADLLQIVCCSFSRPKGPNIGARYSPAYFVFTPERFSLTMSRVNMQIHSLTLDGA